MRRPEAWLSTSMLLLSVWACDEPARPTAGAAAPVSQLQAPVVYGEDTRLDVYAHPDEALRDLARRAIVSEVGFGSIDRSNPEAFVLNGRALGESRNLCEGERFMEQIRVGSCSGTLVGPQTVLTAGHCIDADECPDRAYVFDRFYRAEGVLETVTAEDVYPCRRVLVQSDGRRDYAFVELDRPVTPDRLPVPIRVIEPLDVDTPLVMIGFPNGIPAKIDSGGRVILPGEEPWVRFEATVDAFGGNSGSGIFDQDGALIAILAGGRTDYVDQGECRVVNRLPEDVDDAESLVYVGRALEALCEAEPLHFLCDADDEGVGSWCAPCEEVADCREGWSCADGTCRAPCMDDAQCRSDHRCAEGTCVPQTLTECRRNAVWALPGCGAARLEEDCSPDALCVDGACGPLNPGDRCETALEIPAEDAVIEGRTDLGFTNGYEGECGGEWAEVVYTFTLEAPARLTADVEGFDSLLHLRRDCEEELACNDDRERGDEESRIEVELEPGVYHLFVDGYDENGEYTLTLDFEFEDECRVCEIGARQCLDGGVSACAAAEGECTRWTDPIPCGPRERCDAGACVEAPEGDTCGRAIRLDAESGVVQSGPSDHGATIEGVCGGSGPERIYRVDLAEPTRLQALLAGEQPVLYVRTTCEDEPDLACGVGEQGPAVVDVVLPAGTSFLVADTNGEAADPFQLTLTFECVDCPDVGVEDAGMLDASPPDMAVDAAMEDAGVDAAVDAAPRDAAVDMQRPDMPAPDAEVEPADAGSVDAGEAPAALADDGGCAVARSGRAPWVLCLLLIGAIRRRERG